MKNKFLFNKYKIQGPNYHYQQINKLNLLKFNAFVLARYQIHIDFILKYLNKTNQSLPVKILDVGCGDGVLFYLLEKKLDAHKVDLYGVDQIITALKVAKTKVPSASFSRGNVCQLKFPDNTFDIVVSSDVIEHIKNQEKMVKEIKRVVKKNGLVIIGTPIKFTEKPKDKFHFRELFPNELKLLGKKYFHSVKLIKSHPLLFLLLYKQSLNFFGKEIYIFQILINFLSIFFNINPFLQTARKKEKYFSYMFLLAKKTKQISQPSPNISSFNHHLII